MRENQENPDCGVPLKADLPAADAEVAQPFLAEETVPLLGQTERRAAEEREARLRLALPARLRWIS